VDRLAHHALRGEVWDKAVTYGQQAGARAYARAAFHETVTAFAQALQALAHLPEDGETRRLAIDLRVASAGPLSDLGEHERRLVLLGEAEALARGLDDRVRLGRVLAGMAEGRRITGDLDGALATGHQALELASALGDRALQGQACFRLGQVCAAIGDFGRAVALLRRSVDGADHAADTPRTDVGIQARAWLAYTLGELGTFAEARHHGEEALRLTTQASRGVTLIIPHGCLCELYLTQGDLVSAIRVLEQGLTLCRASGNRLWVRRIVGDLGFAAVLQEHLGEGRARLQEAISESLRTGALQHQARWVAWLSETSRLAGHSAEAWQYGRQALGLARQHKERAYEAYALHQLGVVHAHTAHANVVQAEAHYQQALALAEALGMRPLMAHCHLGLGQLYGQTDRGEEARVALSTAIDLYRAMDMTFWLPQAEAALGDSRG
jgi:tetratricopeptide (TPR) repeat protein